ncbi:hypothetical protein G6F57_010133 [Rhizopus arrhizus]|nr:hypothetical protein G6F57_010133 [Rhizopus arrhizus]
MGRPRPGAVAGFHRLLPVQPARLPGAAVHQRDPGTADPVLEPDPGAADQCAAGAPATGPMADRRAGAELSGRAAGVRPRPAARGRADHRRQPAGAGQCAQLRAVPVRQRPGGRAHRCGSADRLCQLCRQRAGAAAFRGHPSAAAAVAGAGTGAMAGAGQRDRLHRVAGAGDHAGGAARGFVAGRTGRYAGPCFHHRDEPMAARRTDGAGADRRHRAGADRRAAGDPPAALTPEQARARILAVIRAIPAGQVMGYGQVAMRAGLPGRARLTARILGQNDDPDLPWHRVLRSDGRIAMEEGSAGWHEQSQRLRAEGVVVENGRVRMPATDPAAALDAAVWGPG